MVTFQITFIFLADHSVCLLLNGVTCIFSGMIYAFNVGMNANGANMPHEVPIKHFQVIYKMFDDLVDTLSNLLPPLEVEEVVGKTC